MILTCNLMLLVWFSGNCVLVLVIFGYFLNIFWKFVSLNSRKKSVDFLWPRRLDLIIYIREINFRVCLFSRVQFCHISRGFILADG